MRSVGRWLSLVACVWLAGARLGSAQAEDPNTARAHELFKLGVESYDRGSYAAALAAFQEAYQLRPHPAVRVNIANCYEKLDRPAEAIQNFEQFLGSGSGSPKQQEEVVKALDQLRKRVGRLVLRVSPDGAKVVIDQSEPQRAPVSEVVLLKAGRHYVSASLDLYETAERAVDIPAEGTSELAIELRRLNAPSAATVATAAPSVTLATPPSAATPVAAAPSETPDIPASVWISGGITFAAVLTSILTGQLALAADRDFNTDLAVVRNMTLSNDQRSAAWDDGIGSADRAHTYAVATDVLLSCAVVGAVLTTVLYLNSRTPATEASVRASGSNLQLQARF